LYAKYVFAEKTDFDIKRMMNLRKTVDETFIYFPHKDIRR